MIFLNIVDVNIIIAHLCIQVFDFKLTDEDMRVIESFNRNERLIIPTIMVSINTCAQ